MKSVYVIGDSISIQYGPYLERFLKGFLAYSRKSGEEEALLDLDKPQGANGGDSSMVRAYVEARAAGHPIAADFVLFNCGLHDVKTDIATGVRQVSIDLYRRNLRAIALEIRAMGPVPIWARTTPCDEAVHNTRKKDFHRFSRDVLDYNAAADAIMNELGIAVVDLYSFTLNLGPDLYCDHVHFTDCICERQAAFLAGALCAMAGLPICYPSGASRR